MLLVNTVRYSSDDFSLIKKGMIVSTAPLDCTAMSSVTGFSIGGVHPTDTDRKAVFQIDGTWYKLSGSGAVTLSALATQAITADSVLAEGNTVAEIAAATSVAGFVGKSVYVAIALMAPADATQMPSLSLAISGVASTSQSTKTDTSPIYNLSAVAVELVDLSASVTTTGGASATVTVALLQNGSWTGFMPLVSARRQLATAIQFKADYAVPTIGTSSARVDRVSALYRTNDAAVSGDTAEIISITENFDGVGMRFGRITVRHQALQDAQINGMISMRTTPLTREKITIAVGNGSRQTVDLKPLGAVPMDTGINHNTIRLWAGSQEIFEYDFNTETSEASFTVASGVTVFASYSYEWEPETWVAMTKGSTQPYSELGVESTEFTYVLPSNQAGKSVSAVKIELVKPDGTVTAKSLGAATGNTQMIVLEHAAKQDTIIVTTSAGAVSWSYDEASRILTVAGQKDALLSISYDWTAETPVCYGFVAAWTE